MPYFQKSAMVPEVMVVGLQLLVILILYLEVLCTWYRHGELGEHAFFQSGQRRICSLGLGYVALSVWSTFLCGAALFN